MQVIPRVSIYRRRVVLPESGGYKEVRRDPLALIRKAHELYGTVILEDIDAIFGGIPHLDLLKKVEKLDVWVDGGVRFAENAMDVLVAGGAKAVIGTKTLHSFRELDKAVKLTENIVFQVDYCGRILGKIAVQFQKVPDVFETARTKGVETFIFMDNHCSPSPIEELRNQSSEELLNDLYVGILNKVDLAEAEEVPIRGAIVEALELIPDE